MIIRILKLPIPLKQANSQSQLIQHEDNELLGVTLCITVVIQNKEKLWSKVKIGSLFLVWDKEKHQTVLSFVNNYHRSIWISLFRVSFTANRFSFNILPSYFDLRGSIACFLSSINQMTRFLSCVAFSKATHIIYA